MLTSADVQTLALRPERKQNSVLTLYLDVDQSRQTNLNRSFETQLKDMLGAVRTAIQSDGEVKAFTAAVQRIENYMAEFPEYARGLAIVYDASDGFFWGEPVDFPVKNRLQWSREVLLQPLAAGLNEYEPIGIVLLDRAHIRLFTMLLGRIKEHVREEFDHRKVRHTKTIGMDHLGSASHAQHKADDEVRLHLRRAIKDIDAFFDPTEMRRIILAGSPEITAALRRILPKRLARKVIGAVEIPMSAGAEEVRAAAGPIGQQFERDTEDSIVRDLITSAAKSGRVVAGLTPTLSAINAQRVWRLVYAENFHSPGYECVECGALFPPETDSCSFCKSGVAPAKDIVERAVEHAIRNGASVEAVRGEQAGASLTSAGGIGALLRTRITGLRAS